MHIKRLTPESVQQFSDTLRKYSAKISVMEIFFNTITELIDPHGNNIAQNITDILKNFNFKDLDEANAFLMKYNDFTNSAIEFINAFASIGDRNAFDQEVQPLFETLYIESQSRDSYKMLLEGIDKVLHEAINVYNIDFRRVEEWNYLKNKIGSDLEMALSVLVSVSLVMHDGEVDREDLETLRANFIIACSFVSLLDEKRKEVLQKSMRNDQMETTGKQHKSVKVGRNDPCPCGSGKKYKKCCMNKQNEQKENLLDTLDVPLGTHMPLSEKEINDFYAIWTRLIDFTSKQFCAMTGKKHQKVYEKNKEGIYNFKAEIVMEDNYYLTLRNFLLLNFERLVDDFIASSRVSKANQKILQEWKHYRLKRDNFMIYEEMPFGALAWDTEGENYYYVYDLYDSVYGISVQERMLSMLLLPFKGRIIYDGLIGVTGVELGQNAKEMLLNEYVALRKCQEVSTTLPFIDKKKKIYQLKISIKGAKPPVWRRILVEDNMTYGGLHMVIQDIFEWENTHMHEFDAYGRRYTDAEFHDDFMDDFKAEDENKFLILHDLQEVGDKITYTYDFGDDWEHEIKLEAILEKEEGTCYPKCIKGKGRGPLEDIGGIYAHNTIVQAYKEGDQATLNEYYIDEDFDPTAFDLEWINIKLGGGQIS